MCEIYISILSHLEKTFLYSLKFYILRNYYFSAFCKNLQLLVNFHLHFCFKAQRFL